MNLLKKKKVRTMLIEYNDTTLLIRLRHQKYYDRLFPYASFVNCHGDCEKTSHVFIFTCSFAVKFWN